ncbi:hypothetical protein B0T18DRAFT_466545 [Schizothecium vesticola]|uniref:Uncharacterized protein n=1 Tax=Schizothecium vesticola TaxID=314040 RepID=A0AA40EWT7_9PEZI|nr:hypothetical protein B0T18DRAFT_466545 [Schizothecium vesticola]
MVVGDTSRPKLSYRRSIISYRNMSGRLASCSNNASRIRGVIFASRPTRFGGLVVVTNRRSLDRILRTARSLHSTVSAIASLGNSRSIMAWICSRWEGASCGAIGCYYAAVFGLVGRKLSTSQSRAGGVLLVRPQLRLKKRAIQPRDGQMVTGCSRWAANVQPQIRHLHSKTIIASRRSTTASCRKCPLRHSAPRTTVSRWRRTMGRSTPNSTCLRNDRKHHRHRSRLFPSD